jgi:hypothetical protein
MLGYQPILAEFEQSSLKSSERRWIFYFFDELAGFFLFNFLMVSIASLKCAMSHGSRALHDAHERTHFFWHVVRKINLWIGFSFRNFFLLSR